MAKKEQRTPRIHMTLSPGATEKLERYSRTVKKDALATTGAYLLEQKLDELARAGEIPEESVIISSEDFQQIVRFIRILLGQNKANGISFTLLGEMLGIEASDLSNLCKFLENCRNHHSEV